MTNFYIKTRMLISGIFMMILLGSANLQAQIYVSSTGTGNGGSWATATSDLQGAISSAPSGSEIWIQAGIYYAAYDTGFFLVDGVSLYGGFAGTETDKDHRVNYGMGGANETILSGDLDHNGVTDSANAINVTRGYALSSSTFIDGLTISGGYAYNSAGDGGAMYLVSSSPTILNCTFTNNKAHDNGGAIYCRTSSGPAILNCYFIGNSTDEDAGAVYTQNDGVTPYLGNCLFANNTAGDQGGAVWVNHCSTVIANCTFVRNSVVNENGAAMRVYLSSSAASSSPTTATILNCAFWGNVAPTTNDIEISDNGLANINNCALSGTYNSVAGVTVANLIDLSSTDPMFNDTTGTPGYLGYDTTSNWSLKAGSPLIDAGAVGGPVNDILNLIRDANPDIGAYEFSDVSYKNIIVKDDLRIFPNPSSSSFNILLNTNISEIYVMDITGKLLTNINPEINSGFVTLDLSNNPKGVYIVKLIDVNGNKYTEKLILK